MGHCRALPSWVQIPSFSENSTGKSACAAKTGVPPTHRSANAILDRAGKPFCQDESFDRWVWNPAEFERLCLYIENNPVKAGIAKRPEDWHWSSAAKLGAKT